jgi:hypothetical protein
MTVRHPKPPRQRAPELDEQQILAWADAHHARTGEWPRGSSGFIPESPRDHWGSVDIALTKGHRGLPGGSSLARLLHRERGVRNPKALPELTTRQILAWIDAFHAREGRWPHYQSGPIDDAPGETWGAVNSALEQGKRGLPGHSSLAQLLARRRGVRNQTSLPPLTTVQILAWADAHHAREGKWPNADSGPVREASEENWNALDMALRVGSRGLPAGSSLARLLHEERAVRNLQMLPRLTIEQILAWADAHHQRTSEWPIRSSGSIEEAAGETWAVVNGALVDGHRELPGGSSLAQLLAEHRGVRNCRDLPRLSPEQILAWADACHQRTGEWPTKQSGIVTGAPDERWDLLDVALRQGLRGLPAGLSLARLLARERGTRNRKALPPFTEAQIVAWAEAHRSRTGRWPRGDSGPIAEAPGETWTAVAVALSQGRRGLPGGSSLARLLKSHGADR